MARRKPALKIKPEDNIGPPWQWIGTLIIVAVIGLFMYQVINGNDIEMTFVYMAIVGILAGLGLIRPGFIDNLVKSIASKLPGFSFTQEDK